jgi:hypothetical protein
MLTPTFPTAFPVEAVSVIASKIRGLEVPNREAATAAWIIAGYGAGLALGTAPTVGGSLSAIALNDEQALDFLASQAPSESERPAIASIPIPWALLAQWALTKFLEWVAAA